MENNLFYANKNNRKQKEKTSFRKRKENALSSLYEVEHFLSNYKNFVRYIKLYKWLR